MSTTGNQDLTKESQENPVTLHGERVQEAAEGSRIGHISGLDGASVTPAVDAIMAVHPREAGNIGLERNPEEQGDRRVSVDGDEDSDIEPIEEEEQQQEENVQDQDMVDAHRFPMAGFRFMFLDLIHAILDRVYYNNHVPIRRPHENQVMETPVPSASGHSSEVQVPPGPSLSTVRAAEYESDLPEVISTFPELEEPVDFEEAEDHYLPRPYLYVQEPAVRPAAKKPAEKATEELAAKAAAEKPGKKVIEQIIASEGEYHCDNWKEQDNIVDEDKKGDEKNQEAFDEIEPNEAD
ncbi:hypothetical protein HispidOSU_001050, partial [Sigmodon hispidus]